MNPVKNVSWGTICNFWQGLDCSENEHPFLKFSLLLELTMKLMATKVLYTDMTVEMGWKIDENVIDCGILPFLSNLVTYTYTMNPKYVI